MSLFLLWKDDIRHPNPELAVGYAMVVVAQALIELIVFDHASMLKEAIPMSDDRLREEMPRLVLRFLGVAGE